MKLHDGYPEPIKIIFRGSELAYYWRRPQDGTNGILKPFEVYEKIACTYAMLRQVFDNQIMLIKRAVDDSESTAGEKYKIIEKKIAEYIRDGKHNVSDTFIMGRPETGAAGWHCTWYYSRVKASLM